MAVSFKKLNSLFQLSARQRPLRPKYEYPQCLSRSLHASPAYHLRVPDRGRQPRQNKTQFSPDDLAGEERQQYDLLSPDEKKEVEAEFVKYMERMNAPEMQADFNAEVSQAAYEISREFPRGGRRSEPVKTGLMAMGELDEQGSGPDEEYKGDDISSLAHGELEQHREKREYARIAAYEMPMLTSELQLYT